MTYLNGLIYIMSLYIRIKAYLSSCWKHHRRGIRLGGLFLFYISTIICFAYFYTNIPEDFSHSNLIKEKIFFEIQDDLKNNLSKLINELFS